jgi:hypothetical protein
MAHTSSFSAGPVHGQLSCGLAFGFFEGLGRRRIGRGGFIFTFGISDSFRC